MDPVSLCLFLSTDCPRLQINLQFDCFHVPHLVGLVRKNGQYFGPGRWHVICNSGFGNSQFKFMRQGADNGDKLMIPTM